MKCLYLTFSYPNRETGLLYSTHDRIKHAIPYWKDYKIIQIQLYDNWILSILRLLIGKKPRKKGQDRFSLNDLTYYNLWIKRGIFSSVTSWGMLDKIRLNEFICNERYISIKKLDSLINQAKDFDIIMAHWGHPNARIAMKISQFLQIPYCVTYHGSDINVIPKKNRIYKLHIEEALLNASINFMVSQALIDKVTKYNSNIITFLSPNGIPENVILKEKKKSNDIINIIFIGSLNYVKRADQLAAILKNVVSKTQKNIEFTIIGKGEYEELIKSELDKTNINFRLYGEVPRAKVMSILNSSDILLLPSRNEGLPLVILEAIAKKVIPIATNIGGLSEILENDFLVDESDLFIEKFAERVVKFINLPQLPVLNINNYTWRIIIKKEIEIIKKIINVR